MKKVLAIAAAALLLWSCAPKSNSSKGVVLDASMNTVMVVSGSDTLTFSTMNADKSEVDGLFIGDTLEISYEGDYTPGMEASKVAPAKQGGIKSGVMYLTNFAGTPPTIVFASTSFDTAAPAATTALSPISLPGEWQHAPLSRHRGRVLWKHDGDSGLFRPETKERN